MADERCRVTDEELRALGTLADRVVCARVRLHRGEGGRLRRALRRAVLGASGGRAIALGNDVFLSDACCRSLPVLAHELTHCAQYHAWGPLRYFARALADRAREVRHRLGRGPSPYDYAGDCAAHGPRPFETYGMEQQGQIVEDCFRGDPLARELSPYRPPETRAARTAEPIASANASTSGSEVSNDVIQRTSDVRSFHT